MEKGRNKKLIIIVALVLAISGLSIGFAAFTSILTISSSATVTPDPGDFKIKIYGLNAEYTPEEVIENFSPSMLSDTISVGIPWRGNGITATGTAAIDNDTYTIKDMHTLFEGALASEARQTYYFLIVNEGKYDAYINTKTIPKSIGKTCAAGKDTTEAYVVEACKGVETEITFNRINFQDIMGSLTDGYIGSNGYLPPSIKIEKDETVLMLIDSYYRRWAEETTGYEEENKLPLPDGEWDIVYEDITINISTAPPAE